MSMTAGREVEDGGHAGPAEVVRVVDVEAHDVPDRGPGAASQLKRLADAVVAVLDHLPAPGVDPCVQRDVGAGGAEQVGAGEASSAGSIRSRWRWKLEPCSRPLPILWMLVTQTSAPASLAWADSVSWKGRRASHASSTIRGLTRRWLGHAGGVPGICVGP